VAWALREQGITIPGFNLSILGDVPLGAGLSSSASIEVATAFAFLSLTTMQIAREEIALLCQKAENKYVGAMSGIMDQFIACFGEKDHAVLVDTRSLAHTAVPIPGHVHLIICNSMVKHAHAGGEYNTRRAEVDEGSRVLREHNPRLRELRDANLADLEQVRGQMPDNVFRRCRHIITENARVEQTVAAFHANDLAAVGRLMAEAHASYRDDFEASCPEVEVLIELAGKLPGLIGARLTGGGFGGCTVNLVEAQYAESFSTGIRAQYKERLNIDAGIYRCHASAGAGPA
jgi:galactokinase